MPFLSRLSIVLLCLGALVPASRASDATIEMYLRAHVTIAADGTLQAIEWGRERRIPDVLRAKLEHRVRTWSFEPGRLDGVPAETETTLRLRLTAMPVDGGDAYEIRFDNAETGPTMDPMRPPDYPRDALQFSAEAQVLVEMRVAPDGSRHVSLADYSGRDRYRKAFEKATAAALERVEVRPERVGGIEVAARFAIPVSFCIDRGCEAFLPGGDRGSSLPTTAPGEPVPQGSVARLLTDVSGEEI